MTESRNVQPQHLKAGSKSQLALLIILVVLAMSQLAPTAQAESNWNLSADAALLVTNTYLGSGQHYVTPVPEILATRQTGSTTWFIGLPLQGFGVTHRHEHSGLISTLQANFGSRRECLEYSVLGFSVEHDTQTLAHLKNTPDVTTPVVLEAKLQYPTRLGVLEAALGYHPISTRYNQKARDDEMQHGFALRLEYLLPVRVTRALSVAGMTSLGLMDGSYADGWFTVAQETEALDRFKAHAGLRDWQAALHMNYRVSSQISMSAYYSNTLLLEDAAASPYTVDKHQQTFMFKTAYSF